MAEAGASRVELPPLPDEPRVSVVVPARDAADTLPATIRAVQGQQPTVDEIVVAVPTSDEATREVVARLGREDARVRLVDNPTGRTPDALNAAIAASSGHVVVRVDAHAVLPAGYVAAAVATLLRTGAANVGGRQVPVAERGVARAVAAAMRSPLGAGGAAYRTGQRPGPVDTVYLGAFRREALDAVGGFDPRFIRNQDAELNLRLVRAGLAVWFEPSLEVAYRPRPTLRALAAQYFQYGRWRRLTARVHPGSLAPRQLAAPALVLGLLALTAVGVAVDSAWPVGLAAAAYVAILLMGGAFAAPAPSAIVPTAAALAVMHVSWGVGFLVGPPRASTAPRPTSSDADGRT